MNNSLQRVLALTIVLLTLLLFIYRWWKGRKKSGCGGGCACSTQKLKK